MQCLSNPFTSPCSNQKIGDSAAYGGPPIPSGNYDKEGNSHPENDISPSPFKVAPAGAGTRCARRLGATIVRFTCLARRPVRLQLSPIGIFLLVPVGASSNVPRGNSYGPLPVFEDSQRLDIFHHTLTKKPNCGTPPAQADQGVPRTGPTVNTMLVAVEAHPYSAEKHSGMMPSATDAAITQPKIMLFSSELIQLKISAVGDLRGLRELSGRKRKFCDGRVAPKLTQVREAADTVSNASALWTRNTIGQPPR